MASLATCRGKGEIWASIGALAQGFSLCTKIKGAAYSEYKKVRFEIKPTMLDFSRECCFQGLLSL